MTDHSLTRPSGLDIVGTLTAMRRFASHWLKRQRLHRLQQLDDHMLDDIGLLREEIEASLQQPLGVDPVWDLNQRARMRRAGGTRFSFR